MKQARSNTLVTVELSLEHEMLFHGHPEKRTPSVCQTITKTNIPPTRT